MTTGLQLDVTDEGLAAYVDRLAAAGVACLAVGTGRALTHAVVPGAVVRAAERASLPLLEVPESTPFLAVTETVFAQLAAAQYAEQVRALDAQRALTAAAVHPGGPAALAAALAALTGAQVLVTDRAGAVVAGTPELRADLLPDLDRLRAHGLQGSASSSAPGAPCACSRSARGCCAASSSARAPAPRAPSSASSSRSPSACSPWSSSGGTTPPTPTGPAARRSPARCSPARCPTPRRPTCSARSACRRRACARRCCAAPPTTCRPRWRRSPRHGRTCCTCPSRAAPPSCCRGATWACCPGATSAPGAPRPASPSASAPRCGQAPPRAAPGRPVAAAVVAQQRGGGVVDVLALASAGLLLASAPDAAAAYADAVLGPVERSGPRGDALLASLRVFLERNGSWEEAAGLLGPAPAHPAPAGAPRGGADRPAAGQRPRPDGAAARLRGARPAGRGLSPTRAGPPRGRGVPGPRAAASSAPRRSARRGRRAAGRAAHRRGRRRARPPPPPRARTAPARRS